MTPAAPAAPAIEYEWGATVLQAPARLRYSRERPLQLPLAGFFDQPV